MYSQLTSFNGSLMHSDILNEYLNVCKKNNLNPYDYQLNDDYSCVEDEFSTELKHYYYFETVKNKSSNSGFLDCVILACKDNDDRTSTLDSAYTCEYYKDSYSYDNDEYRNVKELVIE